MGYLQKCHYHPVNDLWKLLILSMFTILLPLKAGEKSLRVKVETSFKVGIKESNVGKGHQLEI